MFTFSILDLFCKFCPKINLAFWCCLINHPLFQQHRLEASVFFGINYKVHQQMCKNVPYVKKVVARMQMKHFLNVRQFRHYLVQPFILNFEQAPQEACFSFKFFILVVLALVYYFLQVTRRNFIGKQPFKYVFAKLQVKMERIFCQKFF